MSSPERRGQLSPPETQDRGCRPRCDFNWPSLLLRSRRPSSSLVFITSVTNDSMSAQFRSDWSMRKTIVSAVSSHCLTEGLPCHTPFCADKECVLCIIHREIAVATHLLVSLLKAPQVRVKTAMA